MGASAKVTLSRIDVLRGSATVACAAWLELGEVMLVTKWKKTLASLLLALGVVAGTQVVLQSPAAADPVTVRWTLGASWGTATGTIAFVNDYQVVVKGTITNPGQGHTPGYRVFAFNSSDYECDDTPKRSTIPYSTQSFTDVIECPATDIAMVKIRFYDGSTTYKEKNLYNPSA